MPTSRMADTEGGGPGLQTEACGQGDMDEIVVLQLAHLLQSLREGKPAGTQGLRGAQASQAAAQLAPCSPATTVTSVGRAGTGGPGVMGFPAAMLCVTLGWE